MCGINQRGTFLKTHITDACCCKRRSKMSYAWFWCFFFQDVLRVQLLKLFQGLPIAHKSRDILEQLLQQYVVHLLPQRWKHLLKLIGILSRSLPTDSHILTLLPRHFFNLGWQQHQNLGSRYLRMRRQCPLHQNAQTCVKRCYQETILN